MRVIFLIILLFVFQQIFAQSEDTGNFEKRVLENTEIELLSSFYKQQGNNAAVTGGIGREELYDIANSINVMIPIGINDVLAIDATVSAYSSASSSNLNPFSGASKGGDDDDDDDDDDDKQFFDGDGNIQTSGSPWIISSGASKSDVWLNGNINYSHSSHDRNEIYSAHINIANEFDYFSAGGGFSVTKLLNKKNTEITVGSTVYLDHWRPEYPTEIKTFFKNNGNLNTDYFQGVNILDSNGDITDKNSDNTWKPSSMGLIENKARNTFVISLSFSQILGKRMQLAMFSDITLQKGWLANPMQRVYFADKPDFFIGNPGSIDNYTDPSNTDAFQLADDIERLPDSRMKIPIGARFHIFINEYIVIRSYYRYYFDDWGVRAHTLDLEIPVKFGGSFTLYPSYRFYTQTAAGYFAPFNTHISTSGFYTSDYDLSAFTANQFGFGIKYTDIFTKIKIWKAGVKTIHLDYNHYSRSTGLYANIITLGVKFIVD